MRMFLSPAADVIEPLQLVTIPAPRLSNDDGAGQAIAAGKLVKALQTKNCRMLVKNIASPSQAISIAKTGVPLLLTQASAGQN